MFSFIFDNDLMQEDFQLVHEEEKQMDDFVFFNDTCDLKKEILCDIRNYKPSEKDFNLNIIQSCIKDNNFERVSLIFNILSTLTDMKKVSEMNLLIHCETVQMMNMVLDFMIYMMNFERTFLFPKSIISWRSIFKKWFAFDDIEMYCKIQETIQKIDKKKPISHYFKQKFFFISCVKYGCINILKHLMEQFKLQRIESADVFNMTNVKNCETRSKKEQSVINYFESNESNDEILKKNQSKMLMLFLIHSSKFNQNSKKSLICLVVLLCKHFVKIDRFDLIKKVFKYFFIFSARRDRFRCPVHVYDRIQASKNETKILSFDDLKDNAPTDIEMKNHNHPTIMFQMCHKITSEDKKKTLKIAMYLVHFSKKYGFMNVLRKTDVKKLYSYSLLNK